MVSSAINVLNGKYELMGVLGEGKTSKVYLGRDQSSNKKCAIKLFKEEFVSQSSDTQKNIIQEVVSLKALEAHPNIVKIMDYGDDGELQKRSGKKMSPLIYIVLEYVDGGMLYDICETLGGL